MVETSPSSSDKTAALLTHLGGIFFGFVPSLIVYLVSSNNPWLKEQARGALNFQLTILIAWIVAGILAHLLIGFILFPLIELVNVILSIIAAIKSNQGESYKYPLSLDLIKS